MMWFLVQHKRFVTLLSSHLFSANTRLMRGCRVSAPGGVDVVAMFEHPPWSRRNVYTRPEPEPNYPAPTPINSGVSSQQRSIQWAESSNQRPGHQQQPVMICQHRNYYLRFIRDAWSWKWGNDSDFSVLFWEEDKSFAAQRKLNV